MAFKAGSIISELGLDVHPFRQGVLQAESLTRVFGGTLTNFIANPLLGIVGLAGQAGSALVNMAKNAANSFRQNVQDVAKLSDDMGELAQKANVSVGFMSTFGKIAEDSGSSVGDFAQALVLLNKNLAEIRQQASSGKLKDETWGVMFSDITDTTQALLRLADLVKQLEGDGLSQASLLSELMGRGGRT